MPKATERSNAKRSRSFGGCGTCRRRHVKCDQVQPVCLTCKAVGAMCEGFNAEIRWMTASKDGNEAERESTTASLGVSRRHLYTERHRERMSTSLAASFPIGTVDSSLAELESRSKEAATSLEDLTLGPFGVLNFNRPAGTRIDESIQPVEDVQPVTPAIAGPLLEDVTPISLDSWMGLDDSLQWADLFGFGSDNVFSASEDTFDLSFDLGNVQPEYMEPHLQGPGAGMHPPDTLTSTALAGTWSRLDHTGHTTNTTEFVLREAQLLLRNFKENVIPRFSSLPITNKSPWEMICFTEAVNTLAHLSFLVTVSVSYAKKANLFGVLAISAFYLSRNASLDISIEQDSRQWDDYVDISRLEAKKSLQMSLKQELHGTGKAKYKDQLMAILNLLALAAISGQQREARCYLIDAERLMRHRGLAKREISRRARLLHHMYTWSRILGESTYVLHEHHIPPEGCVQRALLSAASNRQHQPLVATHSSGPGSRLDDFLRVGAHHADSDLEIEEIKEPQTSLHDIHLEDSRENPHTMYTEIYAVSETWLTLLSQTTRLANRIDGIKASNITDLSLSKAISKRSARLEDMVCSFASQFNPRPNSEKLAPNNHMHRALNSALVIFFYRRIRNVNSWILQSHVDDVIAALDNFDNSISARSQEGPGSVWPAFIAGCEATTKEKRDRLIFWIEKGAAATRFHAYTMARDLLLEIGQRKEEKASPETPHSTSTRSSTRRHRSSQSAVSWVDLCRERKVWLMAF